MAVVAAINTGVGAAYLIGPVDAANLKLIAVAIPIPVCAVMFILAGLALGAGVQWGPRFYYAGGFAGAVLYLIWGGAVTLTLIDGSIRSAAGLPVYGGLALLHLLVVYDAHTSR